MIAPTAAPNANILAVVQVLCVIVSLNSNLVQSLNVFLLYASDVAILPVAVANWGDFGS